MPKQKIVNVLRTVVLIAVILAMMAGTVVEKFNGNAFAMDKVYASPWFMCLLGLVAAMAVMEIVLRRLWKNPALLLVYSSVVVILAGGLCTYLFGVHGSMKLAPEQPSNTFSIDKNNTRQLPFTITLSSFEMVPYPGTHSPMDFVSHVSLSQPNGTLIENYDISMNNILKYNGYRFYQEDFDMEGNSTLSVSHDPVGIAVTYAGFILLIAGLLCLMIAKTGPFRTLLRGMKNAAAVALLVLLFSAQGASAQRVLPKATADKMGQMYVLYKGRICPLQTMAKDFTTKLCGTSTYNGFTPEQVLSGWMFYFDDWKNEPVFKIKGSDVRRIMGIEGRWATLRDFTDSIGGHPVADALKKIAPSDPSAKNLRAADEKFNLINMLYNGKLLKIFPLHSPMGGLGWYSQSDDLPPTVNDTAEYLFIRKYMSYSQELVAFDDMAGLEQLFEKTRKFQQQRAADVLPSGTQFAAERLYNRLSAGRWLAMVSITLGLLFFAYALFRLVHGQRMHRWVRLCSILWVTLLTLFLITIFALKWIAGGHIPMAGGFDSMNLMAIAIGVVALVACRRYEMALPIGMMASGFVLLVAMMGGSNPPITHLMPVLASPLLSMHVSVIMLAYAMFFFTMINGVGALIVCFGAKESAAALQQRMRNISLLMLYPAVFLLALGTCIGSVWANVSWGNYWAWDPKEVWALITLLVYSVPLMSQFKALQKPKIFHLYCVLAFLSVLITYFGVNLILGGVHAYN
ncbi:MAG: cytochrome c biogenesis protein CcsA [Bacteroidales bacterium]|nr:cytochrome c biogenesis protein CcsA [Bacteroidales bacterium]